MNEKELEYKESWKGIYNGVQYEICHWRLGWNYYIYIPIKQLPEWAQAIFNLRARKQDKYTFYDYYKAKIIPNLDWHGGITLYEKTRDDNGKVIGYRLGCDYMHLWDEGKDYDLRLVLFDAMHTVDKLWELIPDLKIRCAYNGEYYDKTAIYYNEHGVSIAKENKEKWDKPLFTPSG